MDAKSLNGLAVISIQDGEKVGTIDGLVFNVDTRRIAAFRIARGGILGAKRDLIGFDRIQKLGRDALMIADQTVIESDQSGKKFGSFPDLSAFTGVRVLTESGTYVGEIVTVHVNESTGDITEFEVSGGGMLATFRRNRHVPNSDVRTIGRDVAVVPDSYAPTDGESAEPVEEASETHQLPPNVNTRKAPDES